IPRPSLSRGGVMPEPTPRRSPVHHLLEGPSTQWGRLADAPIALRLGPADEEEAAVRTLALCDVSALAKLGVKGLAAEAWLREQQIDIPPGIYDTRPMAGGGW